MCCTFVNDLSTGSKGNEQGGLRSVVLNWGELYCGLDSCEIICNGRIEHLQVKFRMSVCTVSGGTSLQT
jgi:hypothetical protein